MLEREIQPLGEKEKELYRAPPLWARSSIGSSQPPPFALQAGSFACPRQYARTHAANDAPGEEQAVVEVQTSLKPLAQLSVSS
jgi:hypothetical protein